MSCGCGGYSDAPSLFEMFGINTEQLEMLQTELGRRCALFHQLFKAGVDVKNAEAVASMGYCSTRNFPWPIVIVAAVIGYIIGKKAQ